MMAVKPWVGLAARLRASTVWRAAATPILPSIRRGWPHPAVPNSRSVRGTWFRALEGLPRRLSRSGAADEDKTGQSDRKQ